MVIQKDEYVNEYVLNEICLLKHKEVAELKKKVETIEDKLSKLNTTGWMIVAGIFVEIVLRFFK